MSCRRKEKKMQLIKIENGAALLNPDTSAKIAEFERKAKAIKAQEDELKAAIMEEMKANNILKIETPELVINYIAPSYRETFQTAKFRTDYPALYDEFATISPVKSSIRIKVK